MYEYVAVVDFEFISVIILALYYNILWLNKYQYEKKENKMHYINEMYLLKWSRIQIFERGREKMIVM